MNIVEIIVFNKLKEYKTGKHKDLYYQKKDIIF